MAPKSRIVVYAVRNGNQEILVDATDFRVDGIFQNKVSLSIDTEEAEPGTDVSFKVRADPHSYVGLLAVDQSILLLKAGNDITEELVIICSNIYSLPTDNGRPRRLRCNRLFERLCRRKPGPGAEEAIHLVVGHRRPGRCRHLRELWPSGPY